MRARVEPCHASAHHADVELIAFEIHAIDIGDFKYAALRRFEARSNFDDLTIVKIKSGDRVTGFWLVRLLFNAERLWRLSMRIELDDTIALGIVDGVSKNAGSLGLERSCAQFFDEVVSVENIVAEHQRTTAGADEILADQKCLGNPFGLRLRRVLEMDAVPGAIAEQVLKAGQILGRGDEQNFADAGQDQCGERS